MAVTDLIQAQRANELRESRRITPRNDSNCSIRNSAPCPAGAQRSAAELSYIIFGVVLARQTAAFTPTEAMRYKK